MLRLLLCSLVIAPVAAHADARAFERTTTASGLELARQEVPDAGGAVAARARSRLVYLNRRGVTVTPGANDARVNRSSVAFQQATIDPWPASDALWGETVACLRGVFAPFDLAFTETDPGDAPHIEAVFGGTPSQLGLPARVAGVSPFSTSCAVVEYSMVYAFTAIIPQNAQLVCEIMAQEIAHSYGLDHELLAADPMSYLRFDGARTFQDAVAACGETAPRPCGINGSVCRAEQNSYALLRERLGAAGAGDVEPPRAVITSPRDGATVRAGFEVTAAVSDDVAIAEVALLVDGVVVATRDAAPWTFASPAKLARGAHVLEIVASDGVHTTSAAIDVTLDSMTAPLEADAPADAPLGCAAGGPGAGVAAALALAGLVGRRRRFRL